MRTKKDEKFKLESVEELLGVVNEESAMDIEISKIQSFRAHPFKVLDDDKMQELIDSIICERNINTCISQTIRYGHV